MHDEGGSSLLSGIGVWYRRARNEEVYVERAVHCNAFAYMCVCTCVFGSPLASAAERRQRSRDRGGRQVEIERDEERPRDCNDVARVGAYRSTLCVGFS